MAPKLRYLVVAASVIVASVAALRALPHVARYAPLMLAPAMGLLALARPRHVTDRGIPGGLAGALGSGILAFDAYRLVSHAGLGEAALPALLAAMTLPAALGPWRYLGGSLRYLPLVLFVEPGLALVLPHRVDAMMDPVESLLRGGAAGISLGAAIGFVALRPGVPRIATAAGLAGGGLLGLWAAVSWRLPAAVALALSLLALGGGVELCSQILSPGPARRGRLPAAVLGAAVLLAVVLRTVAPSLHGLSPAGQAREGLVIERHEGASETLVLTRVGEHRQGILHSSRGSFPLRAGDIDVFTGATLAMAYAPRATSALLVGAHPDSEVLALVQAGTYETVDRCQPSPWPWDADGLSPSPSRDHYDLILVTASGPEIEAVLAELPRRLSATGVLAVRRLGPSWEQGPTLTKLFETFPHRRVYWDHERSAVTLLASEPLTFDPAGARFSSQCVASRFASLRHHGLVPTGAWLAPQPEGREPGDQEARWDMAIVSLACGDPPAANVHLGPPSPSEPAWVLGLRALVQAALKDPTGLDRPRTFSRRAMRAAPGNPFVARAAATAAGLEPAARASRGEISFTVLDGEIPAWLLLGPFPVRRRVDPSTLATHPSVDADFLAPTMTEKEALPDDGDRVYLDARTSLRWRLAAAHGRQWPVPRLVPLARLGPAPHPSSCFYAFTEVESSEASRIDVVARRLAVVTVDGSPHPVRGEARIDLPPGRHTILVKAFAASGERAHVAVRHVSAGGAARAIVRSPTAAHRIVGERFRAFASHASLRGLPRRLLVVEMPPVDGAVAALCLTSPAGSRRVDVTDPDQVVPLGDPGRHAVMLTEAEARGSAIEVRTEVSGVVLSRRATLVPAGARRLHVAPSFHVELEGGPERLAGGIRMGLAAVSETRHLPAGERYRLTIESGAALHAFLASATQEDRDALARAIQAEEVELPALMVQMDRTAALPQLLAFELEVARQMGRSLGSRPRVAVVSHGPGLPAGAAAFLGAQGVDLLLVAGPPPAGSPRPAAFRTGDAGPVVVTQGSPLRGAHLLAGDLSMALAGVDEVLAGTTGTDVLVAALTPGVPPPGTASQAVAAWNAVFASPELLLSTPGRYLDAIRGGTDLPAYGGDLRTSDPDAPGSRAAALAQGRRALSSIPPLSLLAERLQGSDGAELRQLLEDQLLSHEHSIVSGPGPRPRTSLRAAADRVCEAISAVLPAGKPYLLVANPLPFPRREVVACPDGLTASGAIQDEGEAGRYALLDAPAMGYAALPASDPLPAGAGRVEADATAGILRSRHYEVQFDPGTGALRRITDRELGSVVYEGASGPPPFAICDNGGACAVPTGPPRVTGGNVRGTIQAPFRHPHGAEGILTVVLPAEVKRLEASVAIARGTAGLSIVLPHREGAGVEVEGPFAMERLGPEGAAMRGGLVMGSGGTYLAVASPDLAWVDTSPLRAPMPAGDAAYRFALTSGSGALAGSSPWAFFRTVESPLHACLVTPALSTGRPLPLQQSFLQAQPDALEILLSPEQLLDATRGPLASQLHVLLRNPGAESRTQKLVFPVEGNYLQFPMAAHQVVGLDIDLTRP